jgi:beta-fructofuranosidase
MRPRVHLTPETGWLNDPHGLYYQDGLYHVFFQHVPDSVEWHPGIHWGHATSSDLLHWKPEPVALAPGDGDDGCWSGCAAVGADGKPVLFYTSARGANHQVAPVRIARQSDTGAWVKGPVVAEAQRPTTRLFRDPMVLGEGEGWRMLVGSGRNDGTAEVDTFVSDDLETWSYDGVLAGRNTKSQHPWTGTGWECPQLIRGNGGGSDILVVSIWDDHAPHDVAAATGTYADGRFHPRRWQLLSAGQSHFAASSFTDADGRPCLIFWIRGVGDAGRWSGALSIPYVVAADGDLVGLAPHPAVANARVAAEGRPGVAIDIEWSPAPGQRLTLAGPDGGEHAWIDAAEGRLTVDVAGEPSPVHVAHTSPILRVLVDAQVLEVVADGGLVGLPLPGSPDGLLPLANDDATVTWWHVN